MSATKMTAQEAKKLLATCAAGYVPYEHPDVRVAEWTLGKKAEAILDSRTSKNDAMLTRLPGCASSRR